MMRRWGTSIALLVAGLTIGVSNLVDGSVSTGVVVLAIFVVLAALLSPRAFPSSVTHAEAVAAGGPIVYWRPGCPFCMRLRTGLGRDASKVRWVDIWTDPEAAAAVRAIADGNETVPTVVFPDRSFVNPAPAMVRSRLRAMSAR